jgi:hypothetical protein
MIVSTVLAATLASAQPAPAIDHGKMDHKAMEMKADKAAPKMDCCKDGCACCAKDKAKAAS